MAESENIVAETAEKIFADLADAQTINHDKQGAWKAPLWQALTEAGLPLSWVPDDLGGSGASLAEGFSVLNVAGRHAIAVPLAETMLAGWLLTQGKIASPEGEMTVLPASPKDRVTLNADGSLSGRARGVPFAKDAKHFAVLAVGNGGVSIALVDAAKCRIESGIGLGGDHNDTVTLDKVQPVTTKPAPKGFDQTTLMLMGGVVRSLQIAGALEAMLDISVRYSNERVAFEKKISKFQAVQHNLARLAGENAAALAAATSGRRHDRQRQVAGHRCGVPRSGLGKNPVLGSGGEGERHRASGAWCDRLHHRAHPAPLFAAGAGLARRFRLGELLGGRARQARRESWRR
ncbi:acyl-CoA dehydrogenase [Bradyrhizobium elkanii]